MDAKVIDMIIDSHKELKADVKNLDEKIDQILEWKWKLVGATIAVSSVLTFLFQITVSFLKQVPK